MNHLMTDKKRGLVTLLTSGGVFVGFNYYFHWLKDELVQPDLMPTILLAILTLTAYLVPMRFLFSYLIRRFNLPLTSVGLSFLLGTTLAFALGAELNSFISMILFVTNVPVEFLETWGAAFTAPFGEELAKGLVVVLLAYLTREKSLGRIFVMALMVGLSVQFMEDILYIFKSTTETDTHFFKTALERISYALGSHTTLTGLVGTGFCAIIDKTRQVPKKLAWLWVLLGVGIHFVFNSPLEGDWVEPVLGFIGLLSIYQVYLYLSRLEIQPGNE